MKTFHQLLSVRSRSSCGSTLIYSSPPNRPHPEQRVRVDQRVVDADHAGEAGPQDQRQPDCRDPGIVPHHQRDAGQRQDEERHRPAGGQNRAAECEIDEAEGGVDRPGHRLQRDQAPAVADAGAGLEQADVAPDLEDVQREPRHREHPARRLPGGGLVAGEGYAAALDEAPAVDQQPEQQRLPPADPEGLGGRRRGGKGRVGHAPSDNARSVAVKPSLSPPGRGRGPAAQRWGG